MQPIKPLCSDNDIFRLLKENGLKDNSMNGAQAAQAMLDLRAVYEAVRAAPAQAQGDESDLGRESLKREQAMMAKQTSRETTIADDPLRYGGGGMSHVVSGTTTNAAPTTPQAQSAWEPDWSTAPEWAMWWAVNSGGVARFYEYEPVRYDADGFWDAPPNPARPARTMGNVIDDDLIDLPLGTDWRTLKQRRVSLSAPAPAATIAPDAVVLDKLEDAGRQPNFISNAQFRGLITCGWTLQRRPESEG
jgi:hypothetical protein